LAVVLTLYYLIKPTWQTGYLLLVSLIFYCLSAKPLTLVYLVISTVSVYFAAIAVTKAAEEKRDRKAKTILGLTLVLNFSLLAVVKYYEFFFDNVNALRGLFGAERVGTSFHIAASLGISYYTLQLTGYLLDCYWKVGVLQTDFLKFALFGCYFPQLTSGPISRYKQIQQNLYEPHSFSYEKVTHGLRRMAWGMFKKMVIADRLGLIVNSVYANYQDCNVVLIWGGIFCFSLQLYTDFSGCMDIVLGTSECLGITLPENFRNPFFSTNTQEFWQRWHITLGTWLKDYIMDPVLKSDTWVKLGENSRRKFGKKWGKRIPTYLGMLILWLAMGLWHGSGWKFIIGEGLWFWLVIISGNLCGKGLQQLVKKLHINPKNILWITFQRLRTFFIFSIGLICFRAENMKQVFAVLKGGVTQFHKRGFSQVRGDLGMVNLLMLCVAFVIFAAVELLQNRGVDIFDRNSQPKTLLRWIGYLVICGMILLSLSISGQSFIYAGF
jgi:D-alanyl-lipoteichoic acid acyltransferase DltB (MBOAT superfamily)